MTTTSSPVAPPATDTVGLAERLRPRLNELVVLLRRASVRDDLSPSQLALLHALRDGAPRRIGDLAAEAGVTQPSMTVLVDRLERAGLVARRRDAGDRRAVLVSITAAGEQTLAEVAATRTAWLAERLESLSADERAAIAAVLPALDRLVSA